MSFRTYINRRRITDDLPGDFVLVARIDPAMPDAETWDELRRYLDRQGATSSVVGSAQRVWRGYVMARLRLADSDR